MVSPTLTMVEIGFEFCIKFAAKYLWKTLLSIGQGQLLIYSCLKVKAIKGTLIEPPTTWWFLCKLRSHWSGYRSCLPCRSRLEIIQPYPTTMGYEKTNACIVHEEFIGSQVDSIKWHHWHLMASPRFSQWKVDALTLTTGEGTWPLHAEVVNWVPSRKQVQHPPWGGKMTLQGMSRWCSNGTNRSRLHPGQIVTDRDNQTTLSNTPHRFLSLSLYSPSSVLRSPSICWSFLPPPASGWQQQHVLQLVAPQAVEFQFPSGASSPTRLFRLRKEKRWQNSRNNMRRY